MSRPASNCSAAATRAPAACCGDPKVRAPADVPTEASLVATCEAATETTVKLTNTAAPTIHGRVEAVGIAGAGLMVSAPVICPSSFASVSVNLVTYRRPPPRPPPPRPPPPPREEPPPLEPPPLKPPLREPPLEPPDRMLDEPRELLARALDPLNPPEPPPKALPLEPPRERSRPEMLLPPLPARLLRPPWLGS
jgi:hypothetical protein